MTEEKQNLSTYLLTGLALAAIVAPFPAMGYHEVALGFEKGKTRAHIEREASEFASWNFDCYMANVLSKPGRDLAYLIHGDNE